MGSAISVHCARASSKKISVEKAVSLLKNSPFHQYLTSDEIAEFAGCFLSTLYSSPGEKIQLDSQRLYIVAQGEVDLSTTYPEARVKVEAHGYLCRRREGDVINLKSTKEDIQRRVSSNRIYELAEDIIVTGSGDDDILLLCADTTELDGFVKSHPDLSKVITMITTSQIEDKLITIPFLQKLDRSKVNVLASMCHYEAFDSGVTVFEEGDNAEKFYLLLGGSVHVIAKETPSSRGLPLTSKRHLFSQSMECSSQDHALTQSDGVVIASLKSGDYFGETALLFNIDRTSTVTTCEKCLMLTVHKLDFLNFLKTCPLESSLEACIKRHLLSNLSLLGIPFFSCITQDMFEALANSIMIHEIPRDHVIFSQGDLGDKFYIVVYGGVEVTNVVESSSSGESSSETMLTTIESKIGKLHIGNYFGEMALVNGDSRRTATVTSTQKSILLSIDKKSFQAIFGSNTQVLAEFELRVLKNRAKLCHILKHPLGLASFRDYLEKEHAGESIDFWVAVTNFTAESPQLSQEECVRKAKHIFLTFCAEYADRQVNLPHNVIVDLDGNLHQSEDIQPKIFDAALSEVYKLMEKDNFRRYKGSQDFKDFYRLLGIL